MPKKITFLLNDVLENRLRIFTGRKGDLSRFLNNATALSLDIVECNTDYQVTDLSKFFETARLHLANCKNPECHLRRLFDIFTVNPEQLNSSKQSDEVKKP